jgi:DNA polymerase IV (archaeal DinB-like DNA polymerase)
LLASDKRIIAAIDLDYFFAQCEEVRRPELKGKPLVICVYSGRTETSGAVSTANYDARALGVKSGIPIANAIKILANRSDATFLPLDAPYYEKVSEKIMEVINSHSEIFEQVSIDEAFIDITKMTDSNYDKAKMFGTNLKEEILAREELTCSIGIGPNKLIAKMASDSKKPDGLTVIPLSQVKDFLDPQPVRKLFGIGPKTEGELNSLGIKTIGDLASAKESVLAERFGRNLGPELKKLACGIDNSPVKQREIEQLSRIITLKHDAEDFDFQKEIEPLCIDISARLNKARLKCKTIGIIIITNQLKTRSRSKTLDAPTDTSELILSVASSEFRSFFAMAESKNKEKARRVGIRVSNLLGEKESSQAQRDLTTLSDFV